MKRVTLASLLLFSITIFAQQGINYKAVIKDNLGAAVSNENIDVRFTIVADTGSTTVYSEDHTGVPTGANGIVILTIGGGNAFTGVFADIPWGSDVHSLKVEIDIEQDGSFVDMGMTQFMSVPYANHSKTATAAVIATALTGGINQGYIAALEARIGVLEELFVEIGDIREGGVVFYIATTPTDLDGDGDLDRGLVCAFSDYAVIREWGCEGIDLPSVPNVDSAAVNPAGPGAEIGDGMDNTISILRVTDCPGAPAALAARSLGPEWFLPSINELNEMYIRKGILESVSGFAPFSSTYWSSSEGPIGTAWNQYLNVGSQFADDRDTSKSVRAIRAF